MRFAASAAGGASPERRSTRSRYPSGAIQESAILALDFLYFVPTAPLPARGRAVPRLASDGEVWDKRYGVQSTPGFFEKLCSITHSMHATWYRPDFDSMLSTLWPHLRTRIRQLPLPLPGFSRTSTTGRMMNALKSVAFRRPTAPSLPSSARRSTRSRYR